MGDNFRQYRPFLIFLGKFLGSYLVLTLVYQAYLSQYDMEARETDGMTTFVAENVKSLLNVFGQNASITPHEREASYKLFLDGKVIVRIVEGCNAVSLMILFTAFLIAFSSTFKKTGLFILCGILLIHILNVSRIALLTMGFRKFPAYKSLMHDILFPLVIYGTVFLLWVVWIRNFSAHAKRKK